MYYIIYIYIYYYKYIDGTHVLTFLILTFEMSPFKCQSVKCS